MLQVIDRAVKVLDQMPPYDTHKIGVVFVGAGQVGAMELISACTGDGCLGVTDSWSLCSSGFFFRSTTRSPYCQMSTVRTATLPS